MKVFEFYPKDKVYFSAQDRFVKKINTNIYEVYHIHIIENRCHLNIVTINFLELTYDLINEHLFNCGLKYLPDKNIIVQVHDESEIVEDCEALIYYTLADRLAISGVYANMNQFGFEDAKDLNQVLLEHDIYHEFDNVTLQSL